MQNTILTRNILQLRNIDPIISEYFAIPDIPPDSISVGILPPIQSTVYSYENCHASTIVHMGEQNFKVAWFQGSREGMPDVSIFERDIDLSAKKRHNPRLAFKISTAAHWNPVLFRDPSQKLHIFFKVGETIDDWQTWHSIYDSNTNKWSEAKRLVNNKSSIGGRGPVRNKPIVVGDGSWLAPASIEKTIERNVFTGPLVDWHAFVDRSINNGKSWKKSKPICFNKNVYGIKSAFKRGSFGGVIQPALWESINKNGDVYMFLRSTAGLIFRSDSSDYGKTWTHAYATKLPNNNSSIDIAQNNDGILCMVHNPVSGNWAARTPLSLSFSYDGGMYWTAPVNVLSGEGSFSYPAIISVDDYFIMSCTINRVMIAAFVIKCDSKFSKNIKEKNVR